MNFSAQLFNSLHKALLTLFKLLSHMSKNPDGEFFRDIDLDKLLRSGKFGGVRSSGSNYNFVKLGITCPLIGFLDDLWEPLY